MKEGWKYMKLGEISESIKDGDWIEKKDQSLSGFRLIQTGNIGVGLFKNKAESARYISEETFSRLHCEEVFEGDILISRLPDPVGRACIVPYLDTRNITAVDCSIVKLNSKIINSDYFLLYTQSNKYFNQISSLCTGSTRQRITRKKLTELQIPVPPLSDQQRIVSYLDSEFAKIEALKANAEKQLQAAKDLFQAALKELLTPKEGWVEKKLGEIGNICGRIGFRGYTTKDMVSGPNEGAITLSPSNIQDGAMDYTKCQYISWYKYNESPEIMVQNGDVLIVKTGSSYGKSAIVENLPHKATINPQSVVIKKIRINNRLFAYLIRTPWVQNDFDNFVAGTAIPTFSQANLSKVLLTFPQDLNEQQRIADRLDALSANVKALQTNYTETITLCNDLKQALLKKVFE